GVVPQRPVDAEEQRLIARLRAHDEDAFMELVDRYSASLLRVALLFVSTRAVAEEVVQETWLGVLAGIDRFEGRSSLKTWIFRILTNRAKTRAVREARSIPFSSLAAAELGQDEPSVDPDRFLPASDPRWPGHWASSPRSWGELPEQRLLGAEARRVISDAIDMLPPVQRAVISLRDVEGWSSEEVREELDLSDGNQRVLLHRARSKVRAALDEYLAEAA
ncbi:MAG TPA: sigma-70 family RNA polymerase sigma factor, partial [Gaiellaceae bacterium]|nr:sigma-70 family RNA polymerase sigma factor [Gaiellaceae bacterium]